MHKKKIHNVKILVLIYSLLIVCGCTKSFETVDPPTEPPVENDPNSSKPKGLLYVASTDGYKKINTIDSSLIWSVGNYGVNYNNPMLFDSVNMYRGTRSSVSAYSLQTGAHSWDFYSLANAPGSYYKAITFKDSFLLTATSNSLATYCYLCCLNKYTGKLYWKTQIDQGSQLVEFTSTPLVYQDHVVAIVRDKEKQRHLAAFNVIDGKQLWQTDVTDNLKIYLKIFDGNIYSTASNTAYC